VRSRLPAFRATGPGPVLIILPTIEDADTTCPEGRHGDEGEFDEFGRLVKGR